MKILFFSDVHGSPESVELLLAQAGRLQPELFVLLGDVLYHGPRNPLKPDYAPRRVTELLNPLREKIVAVRGNCDSEVDQMMLEFPLMADYSTLLAEGHKFFLTHGHHWNPATPPPIGSGSVLAFGHTHIPCLETCADGLIAFNPGSISLPKGGNPPSFGLLDGGRLSVRELSSGEEMLSLLLP